MGVDPQEPQTGKRPRSRHRLRGGTRRQSETELRVLLTGSDEFVGVGLDAGRDAYEHVRTGAGGHRARQVGQPIDLVERVDHDAPHSHGQSTGQFLDGLVVAVHDETTRRHPCRQRDVQLTTGRHVQPHPFFVGQTGHRRAQKGLGGIGHALTPGGHRLPAAGPEMGLVVDEEGSPHVVGEGHEVDAADTETPVDTGFSGDGEQLGADRSLVRSETTPGRTLGVAGHGP